MHSTIDIWNRWNEGGGPKYPHEKVVQFCFRNFPQDRRTSLRALDVGCGSGVHTVFLAHEGFKVTATDISEVGIANTKHAIESRGLGAVLRVESADRLADPPETFDLIVCVSVYDSAGPVVAKRSVGRLQQALVRGGRGLFLFASDRDFRIQQENRLGLYGYSRGEVDELFAAGFSQVWVDRYITTYHGQEYEQNDWLVTLVR